MRIQFYQIKGTTPAEVDAVVPSLLGRILEQQSRAVILCPTEERVDRLSQYLWSHEPTGFLPHATMGEAQAAHQPVWVTHKVENPNQATFLLTMSARQAVAVEGYDRVLDLFDESAEQVAQARLRWKAWKEAGHELSYYALSDAGWQKKA